jgi:hypothetical protein
MAPQLERRWLAEISRSQYLFHKLKSTLSLPCLLSKNKIPEHIALEGFVTDFKVGLWQALRRRFPDFDIQDCAFHWSQAVFRKIQDHGLQVITFNLIF